MSKYTTEVRYICESSTGLDESEGYLSVNDILEKCVDNVFNFDFPVFDENYRRILEKKILKHYYTREIGFESVGLWKLKLDAKLNEVMPYFNQLYKSELLAYNPLYDVDYQTTHTLNRNESAQVDNTGSNITDRTNRSTSDTNTDTSSSATGSVDTETNTETNETGNTTTEHASTDNTTVTGTGENKGTSTSTEMYSDTPQGSVENLETGRYLTNAKKTLGSDTTSTTSTDITNSVKSDSTNTSESKDTNVDTNKTTKTKDSTEGNASTNVTSENTGNDTTKTTFNENRNFNSVDDYIERVTGKTSGHTYASLVKEFRENFLNIDMMVIESLSSLFLNLW